MKRASESGWPFWKSKLINYLIGFWAVINFRQARLSWPKSWISPTHCEKGKHTHTGRLNLITFIRECFVNSKIYSETLRAVRESEFKFKLNYVSSKRHTQTHTCTAQIKKICLSTRHNLNVNDEWKIIFILHYNLEKRFPQVQKQCTFVLRWNRECLYMCTIWHDNAAFIFRMRQLQKSDHLRASVRQCSLFSQEILNDNNIRFAYA